MIEIVEQEEENNSNRMNVVVQEKMTDDDKRYDHHHPSQDTADSAETPILGNLKMSTMKYDNDHEDDHDGDDKEEERDDVDDDGGLDNNDSESIHYTPLHMERTPSYQPAPLPPPPHEQQQQQQQQPFSAVLVENVESDSEHHHHSTTTTTSPTSTTITSPDINHHHDREMRDDVCEYYHEEEGVSAAYIEKSARRKVPNHTNMADGDDDDGVDDIIEATFIEPHHHHHHHDEYYNDSLPPLSPAAASASGVDNFDDYIDSLHSRLSATHFRCNNNNNEKKKKEDDILDFLFQKIESLACEMDENGEPTETLKDILDEVFEFFEDILCGKTARRRNAAFRESFELFLQKIDRAASIVPSNYGINNNNNNKEGGGGPQEQQGRDMINAEDGITEKEDLLDKICRYFENATGTDCEKHRPEFVLSGRWDDRMIEELFSSSSASRQENDSSSHHHHSTISIVTTTASPPPPLEDYSAILSVPSENSSSSNNNNDVDSLLSISEETPDIMQQYRQPLQKITEEGSQESSSDQASTKHSRRHRRHHQHQHHQRRAGGVRKSWNDDHRLLSSSSEQSASSSSRRRISPDMVEEEQDEANAPVTDDLLECYDHPSTPGEVLVEEEEEESLSEVNHTPPMGDAMQGAQQESSHKREEDEANVNAESTTSSSGSFVEQLFSMVGCRHPSTPTEALVKEDEDALPLLPPPPPPSTPPPPPVRKSELVLTPEERLENEQARLRKELSRRNSLKRLRGNIHGRIISPKEVTKKVTECCDTVSETLDTAVGQKVIEYHSAVNEAASSAGEQLSSMMTGCQLVNIQTEEVEQEKAPRPTTPRPEPLTPEAHARLRKELVRRNNLKRLRGNVHSHLSTKDVVKKVTECRDTVNEVFGSAGEQLSSARYQLATIFEGMEMEKLWETLVLGSAIPSTPTEEDDDDDEATTNDDAFVDHLTLSDMMHSDCIEDEDHTSKKKSSDENTLALVPSNSSCAAKSSEGSIEAHLIIGAGSSQDTYASGCGGSGRSGKRFEKVEEMKKVQNKMIGRLTPNSAFTEPTCAESTSDMSESGGKTENKKSTSSQQGLSMVESDSGRMERMQMITYLSFQDPSRRGESTAGMDDSEGKSSIASSSKYSTLRSTFETMTPRVDQVPFLESTPAPSAGTDDDDLEPELGRASNRSNRSLFMADSGIISAFTMDEMPEIPYIPTAHSSEMEEGVVVAAAAAATANKEESQQLQSCVSEDPSLMMFMTARSCLTQDEDQEEPSVASFSSAKSNIQKISIRRASYAASAALGDVPDDELHRVTEKRTNSHSSLPKSSSVSMEMVSAGGSSTWFNFLSKLLFTSDTSKNTNDGRKDQSWSSSFGSQTMHLMMLLVYVSTSVANTGLSSSKDGAGASLKERFQQRKREFQEKMMNKRQDQQQQQQEQTTRAAAVQETTAETVSA